MKNLVLLSEQRQSVAGIVDFCDGGNRRFFLTATGHVVCYNNKNHEAPVWTCPLNTVCTRDDWFGLSFIENETLIVLGRQGAIVSMDCTGQAELMGEFDHGIHAAAWSPDGQVLVLVTSIFEEEQEEIDEDGKHNNNKKQTVLVSLNSNFEVLAQVEIPDTLLQEPIHLTWRPNARQFAVSSVDLVDQIRKIRLHDGHTAQCLATGRVQNGSGQLVPRLLASDLAWAGPGCSHLITTIQQKNRQTIQVAFLEPNGLRHGEFVLHGPAQVKALEWNTESDLLGIWLLDNDMDKIQLWHRSNYHWYLKQELCFGTQQVAKCQFHPEKPYILMIALRNGQWVEYEFKWETSTVSASGTAWVVDGCRLNMTPLHHALVPPPDSAATLTFEKPVCNVVLGMDWNVLFLSDGTVVIMSRESYSGRGIQGWKPPAIVASGKLPNLNGVPRSTVIVASEHQSLRLITACHYDNRGEHLLVVSLNWNAEGHVHAKIDEAIPVESSILTMTNWADCRDGALLQLDNGQLLEYDTSDDGSLIPSQAEPLLEPCIQLAAIKFPAKLGTMDDPDDPTTRRLVVGMSRRGRLYCHDVLLCDSTSSFFLAQDFLCFATFESKCQLRFLALTELANFDPFMDEPHTFLKGYEPRSIERGARLVAVLSTAVVLQMPRGNLEMVHPRALILRYSMLQIMNREYAQAFAMMRRQKVDLNLLVDMDPDYFLAEGVAALVDQIQNVDHLNLFISSLQNWNSTLERYPIPRWIRQQDDMPESDFDFSDKVNQVCQCMRTVMMNAERMGQTCSGTQVKEGTFLLPILSTFAKQDPPKLEEALNLIKENAMRHDVSLSKKPPLFSDKAQSSIQYLAFLAEYKLLFDRALGQYDYDMARAVARNSQMDPKMYLPLLKRYNELPPFYGRYEVDVRLGRYEFALRNLAQSCNEGESLEGVAAPQEEGSVGNSHEDCMELIQEHGLYRLGLELFQDSSMVQRIMLSLGDFLMNKKKPGTALGVFLAAPELDEGRAMQAARAARDWKTFFGLACQTTNGQAFDQERKQMLAHDIADDLACSAEGNLERRHLLANAARILLDYGKDVVNAVDMLIRAEMWAEGQRIALLHSRQDLAQRCLDAADSYAHMTVTDLEERSQTFQQAMARYVVVLKIRKEAIASGEAEDVLEDNQQDDDTGSLYSAASHASIASLKSTASTGTVSSLSSVISAKSTSSFSVIAEHDRHKSKFNQLGERQRQKKKKKKGKSNKVRPGSQAELLGLVDTLKRSVIDDVYRTTIADTISFLSHNGRLSLAKTVYDSYVSFCQQVLTCQRDRIETARQEQMAEEARARREGTDGQPHMILKVEKQVDDLACVDLCDSVMELFSFLPPNVFS